MTLSDLANIGQVIGSLAVVGSLIFVGLQVRENTKVNQASALRQNAEYWLNYMLALADPKFSKIYAMGASGHTELDNQQFRQFYLLCHLSFMGCANQYYQYRRGVLDQGGYAGYETAIREHIATFPGNRAIWQLVRHTYSTDFATFMDKQISAGPAHKQQSMFQKWKQLMEGENRGTNAPDRAGQGLLPERPLLSEPPAHCRGVCARSTVAAAIRAHAGTGILTWMTS